MVDDECSSTDTEEEESTDMDQREYQRLNSWQNNQVEVDERQEYAKTAWGRKLRKNGCGESLDDLSFPHGGRAKITSSRGRSRSPRDSPAGRNLDDSPQLHTDLRRERRETPSRRTRSQENIRFTMEGVMHPTESSTPRRKPVKTDEDDREQRRLLDRMREVEERLTRCIDNSLRDAGNCLDRLLQNSRQEPEAAMTLRNGKQLSRHHEHQLSRDSDGDQNATEPEHIQSIRHRHPSTTGGEGKWKCAVCFLVIYGHDLNEGASKWITKLEESTAGVKLALGDIKALLMHVTGKQMTEEVFLDAQLPLVVRGNTANHIDFGGHRNFIWAQLRRHYPEKMDPTKLEEEALNEAERPAKFLRDFPYIGPQGAAVAVELPEKLMDCPRFVLTQARKTGYEVILAAPELPIQRCNTVNPATRMVTPEDGDPHDCIQVTTDFMRVRNDLYNQPIVAECTLFVDG
ncbi:uncharacterized protein V6R79_020607 [Siganus canaliculatus]